MRTTLDIDEDVLEIAKGLAAHRKLSLGRVVSDLLRRNLTPPVGGATVRSGLRVIRREPGATPVTLDVINRLRDEVP